MKDIKTNAEILVSICILIWMVSGCEYNAPISMWNQPKVTTATPVIQSIDPPDSSLGGDIEIRILGENFSENAAENFVYFNSAGTRVKSATSGEIVIYRPPLTGDSLTISLVVQKALEVVTFDRPYKITSVSQSYGGFLSEDYLEMITVDGDENLYGGLRDKSVVKISPSGERSNYGTLRFRGNSLRMGAGGYLYAGCNRDVVYRIPPGGGEYEEYVELTDKVKFIDFDQDGNLYAGGKEVDFFVVKPDLSIVKTNAYDEIDITTVRFYNNYFWVGGQYEEDDVTKWGVWKGQFNGTSIGDPELVLSSDQVEGYETALLLSLTFSAEGAMLIGTDQNDPILLLRGNEVQPLYYDILEPEATQMVWGSGNYLYVFNALSSGVIRIDMGGLGAPYWGR